MALKAKGLSKFFVWILMGLLLVGLAGFGAVNLSGSATSVAEVGDEDVRAQTYARALQQELNRVQQQTGRAVSFADAQSAGLDRQVLSQLVTDAALNWEAARLGISVDDAVVADQLRAISAFQGSDGSFNRDAYRYALDNAGLSVSEFEDDLRSESARAILQGAVISGGEVSDTYIDTVVAFAGETRDITWAMLDEGALATGVPVPTEEDLRAYYETNIDRYTRPETKRVTYAWVTPDMLVDTVEVSEEALRRAYEEREAEFNLPERRLVERLVFGDEAEAQAAADAIKAGETTFDALAEERGLDLSDIDMGVVTRRDLGDAAQAVFSTRTGNVAGPAPSPLGPALFRVNAELSASETPFEEAESTLRDSLVLDTARREIANDMEDLENRLAGGATLEDLANETRLELGELDWAGQSGDGIAGYPAVRETLGTLEPGDYPTLEELGDGGVYAMRVDEILPEAPRPFDEVRDQVETGWERARITEALTGRAEDIAGRIATGESFEAAGLEPRSLDAITRDAPIDSLPPDAVARAFELAEGETAVLPGAGRVAILRLDAVVAAETESDQSRQLADRLRQQGAGELSADLFGAFVADIQRRAGVAIDQPALNAVHSNFR